MFRKVALVTFVLVLSLIVAAPAFAGGPPPSGDDSSRVRVSIYVTSQGLVYDSIVGPALPHQGPFQKLEMGGPTGIQTEFGPGDPGHVDGRWWVDVNGNEEMDADDAYFSCPLLGPGYELPV